MLGGRERIYYADYKQKSEVLRVRESRITTTLDDRKTVSAMLDLAQERRWDRIKLTGSDSFRREAWVQAHVRGIETTGYQPQNTDLQEVARRVAPANQNAAPAEKAPTPQQKNGSSPADDFWQQALKVGREINKLTPEQTAATQKATKRQARA